MNAEQISKCEKLDLDRGVFMDYYSGLDGCLVIGTPAFAPIVIKDE